MQKVAISKVNFFPVPKWLLLWTLDIPKEIQIILRLFVVIAMYCQASSSQFNQSLNLPPVLAGWEGSLGTCSRKQFTRNNLPIHTMLRLDATQKKRCLAFDFKFKKFSIK